LPETLQTSLPSIRRSASPTRAPGPTVTL
jgi:hypothetical protein